MARPLQRIDLAAILAERRFGVLHLTVLGTCALALFAAGFDTELMGAAAPDVARALDLPARELAQSANWTAVGSLLGMLLGAFGDRIGRRRAIYLSLLAFGAASLATAGVTELQAFRILRLLTGLGVGVLLANALALTLELMPRRSRLALTSLAWIGFAAGSVLVDPIAASLLQSYVWQAVFLMGGMLPVVLALVMWSLLPESPLFLVRRGALGTAQIRATLARISRRYDSITRVEFVSSEPSEPGMAILRLFRHGRAVGTVLLWAAFLMAALGAHLFDASFPAAVAKAQLSEANAAMAQAVVPYAGIAGGLAFAYAADRFERFAALAAGLLAGAAVLALLALAGSGIFTMLLAIAAAFFVTGGEIALGVFAAASYPTGLRATGAGWALAAGRVGQAGVSFLVPAMVARHMPLGGFLAAAAVLGLVAACVSLALAFVRPSS